MNELSTYFKQDPSTYILFLDRDGVINRPMPDDYVKRPEQWVPAEGAAEALAILMKRFARVVLVTNQQGIGRKLMSGEDLEDVHLKMHAWLKANGLPYFDAVFYAPYLRSEGHGWRKPAIGMAEQAATYFPELDMKRSVMVGDAPGDMQLGASLGSIRVRIDNPQFDFDDQDLHYGSLLAFAQNLTQI